MSSCPALTATETSSALPSNSLRLTLGTKYYLQQAAAAMQRWRATGVTLLSSVWMLLIAKAIIGFVSAFDTYLTIKYAGSLDVYEQNPLGRWLMGLDDGPVCGTQQIAAFITAKFIGTLLVLITIQGLAYWRVRVACLVALPVTVSQLYLAAHLTFGVG